MSRLRGKIGKGITMPRMRIARGDYDFAVNAGAQGTIALMGDPKIPLGALIISGRIIVDTAVTSLGSATIAVQVESAGDIVATTGKASWTTGVKNVLPADTSGSVTAATEVLTTAARDISIVIATADLTAGKFSVILEYLDPRG